MLREKVLQNLKYIERNNSTMYYGLMENKKEKKLSPHALVISVVSFYRSRGVYPVNRGLVVALCVELGAPNPQIANIVIQNAINNKQIVETPNGLKFADMDNN